jgi:hypothetical protein
MSPLRTRPGYARLALCALALVALLAVALAGAAAAQGGYELSWWALDGGGGTGSAGPGYSLGGAIGQPDAGSMSGPGYVLAGGFWAAAGPLYRVHLPVVVRGWP